MQVAMFRVLSKLAFIASILAMFAGMRQEGIYLMLMALMTWIYGGPSEEDRASHK
jgi:hypothetical protein